MDKNETAISFLILTELMKMNDILSHQYEEKKDYRKKAYDEVQDTLKKLPTKKGSAAKKK